jgi:hypothetical protein
MELALNIPDSNFFLITVICRFEPRPAPSVGGSHQRTEFSLERFSRRIWNELEATTFLKKEGV